MKFFYDTEFIEDGKTIDLISIGIVAEDGREYYAQNVECDFKKGSDWVWRNVYPSLEHFDMRGRRICSPHSISQTPMWDNAECSSPYRSPAEPCPWRTKRELQHEIINFVHPGIEHLLDANVSKEEFPKPEFWAYYGSYDWVVLCQIFGTMMQLPRRWPMYVHDLKQLCDQKGNPALDKAVPDKGLHNALDDARWNKAAHEFLVNYPGQPE